MSNRSDLMSAIVTRLQTIDGTGSFNNDLSSSVFRDKPQVTMEDLPVAVVRWTGETAEPNYGGYQINPTFEVEVLVDKDTGTADLVIDNAIEDVLRALTSGDATFGGTAESVIYQKSEIFYPDEGDKACGVEMSFYSQINQNDGYV